MNAPATIPLSRIADIVGAPNVIANTHEIADYSVDGVTPRMAARPASAQEVSELVKFAAAEKLAIIPTGARTKLAIGLPPARYDLAIDMTRLDHVISYDPGDLTLSVEPGIPLARLAKVLAEHNQFLPLEVPFFDRATVGGTLASGVDSPLRQSYGTARDFVLGMEFVSGDGALMKSGGRVVKNVSGYDLHKLMLGSFGSLGVITRINFKTFPLPRTAALFLASFSSSTAASAFNMQIQSSLLRFQSVEIVSPKAIEILNASVSSLAFPANDSGFRVAVSIAANEAVIVRAHPILESFAREARPGSLRAFERVEPQRENILRLAMRDFPILAAKARDAAVIKLSALPASIATFSDDVAAIVERHSFEMACLFRGVGVGYCALCAPRGGALQLKPCCEEILTAALEAGTHASIPWCPLELKRHLNIWGPPREDFPLMQRVKRAFDPHNVFAPGRFVGGL